MTNQLSDSTVILAELRTLSCGSLLVIAERAAEFIPADQLGALLGDFVKLESDTCTAMRPASMLGDTRKFFDSAMAGDYYETVEINNRSRQEQSASTDAFAAEFDRLLRRCPRAAEQGEFVAARNSIELLFVLLRTLIKETTTCSFSPARAGRRMWGSIGSPHFPRISNA